MIYKPVERFRQRPEARDSLAIICDERRSFEDETMKTKTEIRAARDAAIEGMIDAAKRFVELDREWRALIGVSPSLEDKWFQFPDDEYVQGEDRLAWLSLILTAHATESAHVNFMRTTTTSEP